MRQRKVCTGSFQRVWIAGMLAILWVPATMPWTGDAHSATDEQRMVDLYQRLAPATVSLAITYESTHPLLSPPTTGVGAGFVVDEAGTILTNTHVVEGARVMTAILYDGRRVPVSLIGQDPTSDVAVLRLDLDESAVDPVVLGDSDTVQIGQQTVVVGSPFGLGFTLTTGIVSGLGPAQGPPPFTPARLIQTTAPLNPGNSGGPVVDTQGRVVGIATATLTGAQNIGFAIPINLAKQVLAELKEKGQIVRPWLGVTGKFITEEFKELFALPLAQGLLVEDVEDNSPAAEAGFRTGRLNMTIEGIPWVLGGDILISVQGRSIATPDAFHHAIDTLRAGQEIRIEFLRDGRRLVKSVVLRERPTIGVRGNGQPRQPISTAVPKGVGSGMESKLRSF